MHKTCIFFAYMQKFCINMQFLGGGVLVLLNKHFLTKVLTLNICLLKKFVFSKK